MTNVFDYRNSKVSAREQIVFMRKFQVAFHAAVPLLTIFDTIAAETPNRVLWEALVQIKEEMSAGTSVSLYTAMSKHDTIFSPLTLALIDYAESTGDMVNVLGNIIVVLEEEAKLQEEYKGN